MMVRFTASVVSKTFNEACRQNRGLLIAMQIWDIYYVSARTHSKVSSRKMMLHTPGKLG